MYHIRRFFAILLAAVSFMVSAGELPCEASDEDVYRTLYRAFAAGNDDIRLSGSYTTDQISAVIARIRREAPEICWVGPLTYSYTDQYFEISVEPVKGFSKDKLPDYYYEVEAKANAIAREASKLSGDVEKLKFVHDYLVNNCEYDLDSMGAAESLPAHTAYGCLIQHMAVCSGYSKAFQLIVKKLGIECGRTTGMATNSHEWNYVLLGDDYYWIDVTWDDPVNDTQTDTTDKSPLISQKYFLINDEMLLRGRTIASDNYFVPTCSTLELNPFYRNGMMFDYFSSSEMSDRIDAYYSQGYAEFMFTNESAYNSCFDFLSSTDVWDMQVFKDHPVSGKRHLRFWHDDKIYYVLFVHDQDAMNASVPTYPAEIFPESGDYPALPEDTSAAQPETESQAAPAAVTTRAVQQTTGARTTTSAKTTTKAAVAAAEVDTDPDKGSGGFGLDLLIGIAGGAVLIAVVVIIVKNSKPARAPASPAPSGPQYYAPPPSGPAPSIGNNSSSGFEPVTGSVQSPEQSQNNSSPLGSYDDYEEFDDYFNRL